MEAAIGLYYAFGGRAEELQEIILKANNHHCSNAADAVAQMLVATAAVHCAADPDKVQAAYN